MVTLKIAHLSTLGPRAPLIINQGLIQLGYNFDSDRSYREKGEIIKPRSTDILSKIKQYDLIICGNPLYKEFLDDKNLWKKVVWYDYADSPYLDSEILNRASLYFKRSLVTPDRNKIIHPTTIYPIDYCCLEQYFVPPRKKTINVSCLFLPEAGQRRSRLVSLLKQENLQNSMIGEVTISGSEGRNAINKRNDTCYKKYLEILSASKIVFTAFPQNHDGDSRTWESFASGALVFKDTTYIRSENEPQNSIHCYIFDANDTESTIAACKKSHEILNDEDKKNRIASRGLTLVKQYHLAKNRVKYILNTWEGK